MQQSEQLNGMNNSFRFDNENQQAVSVGYVELKNLVDKIESMSTKVEALDKKIIVTEASLLAYFKSAKLIGAVIAIMMMGDNALALIQKLKPLLDALGN